MLLTAFSYIKFPTWTSRDRHRIPCCPRSRYVWPGLRYIRRTRAHVVNPANIRNNPAAAMRHTYDNSYYRPFPLCMRAICVVISRRCSTRERTSEPRGKVINADWNFHEGGKIFRGNIKPSESEKDPFPFIARKSRRCRRRRKRRRRSS